MAVGFEVEIWSLVRNWGSGQSPRSQRNTGTELTRNYIKPDGWFRTARLSVLGESSQVMGVTFISSNDVLVAYLDHGLWYVLRDI